MTRQLTGACKRLLDLQDGVIAAWQLRPAGVGSRTTENLVRYGRWQPLRLGVYAAFTGEPTRVALRWAALLRAGPHAVLSHETAAEVDRLTDISATMFHVTVPLGQRLRPIAGVVIHRSSRIQQARWPAGMVLPPRTLIEETVLDLTQQATTFDEAFAWVARACQRNLTSPGMIGLRIDIRKRLRWRRELAEALGDVEDGVHSTLEYRYLRDVERPHGLPSGRRQAQVIHGGRRRYLDLLYDEFRVCVELDGQAAHPAEERWRDIRRDNRNAADGIQTLRYGWKDVARPCQTALATALVLQRRGWTGTPSPCGPTCPVARRDRGA